MTPARRIAPTEVPGLTARRIAADILDNVLRRRRPLDGEIEGADAHPGLAALADRDRALVRKLVATVLRRIGTLRHLLGKFLDSGFPKDAPRVETVLLIGAAQILFLDVPDHAAVDLSVRLVQADRRAAKYPGLINAVLRRVTREGPELIKTLDAVPLDTPPWLFERWTKTYGEETARAIAIAHGHEPPLDLTVKADAESWAQRLRGRVHADRHDPHRHRRAGLAAARLSRGRVVGAGRRRRAPRPPVRRCRGQARRRPVRRARRQDRAARRTPARVSPRSTVPPTGWCACARTSRGSACVPT